MHAMVGEPGEVVTCCGEFGEIDRYLGCGVFETGDLGGYLHSTDRLFGSAGINGRDQIEIGGGVDGLTHQPAHPPHRPQNTNRNTHFTPLVGAM